MIDWLTMCARLTHPERLLSGRMVVISPEGEVKYERDQALQVEGSHDARVLIWSHPNPVGEHGHYVRVSGCPSKFLQGHNVFGSNDIQAVAVGMLEGICAKLELEPTELDRADWKRGNIGLSMVDVTESWELSSREQVRAAIRALNEFAWLRNRGGGKLRGGTCYWGQHSRRWALKCYSKGDELQAKKRGHKLPFDLPLRDELTEHADRLLRFELRLLSMELQRQGANVVRQWHGAQSAPVLHSQAMSKLEISEAAMLKPDVIEGLPPRLVLAYQSWQAGHDLRATLPDRTFYRYRAELLKHGVDIALLRPRVESNVVPLRVVLHAYPVGVPDWARGTSLYFEPRAA